LLEIFCSELVFEWEELSAVGCGGGEAGVVEREEKRVDVRDPAEAWWLNSDAHGDAVGEHRADVGFVEDVGRVVFALLLARGFACGFELLEAGGVERGLPIEMEDGLPCVVERGKVGTHTGGFSVRVHGVDGEGVKVAVSGVGGWGEEWVCVVVDGGDGGDLLSERGVDGEIGGLWVCVSDCGEK